MDITTFLICWYAFGWVALALEYYRYRKSWWAAHDGLDVFLAMLFGPVLAFGSAMMIVCGALKPHLHIRQQYWWRKPSENRKEGKL